LLFNGNQSEQPLIIHKFPVNHHLLQRSSNTPTSSSEDS